MRKLTNDEKRRRKYGGGYETAIIDVWYVLSHLPKDKNGNFCNMPYEISERLLASENRLRGVLEASGRFAESEKI